MPSVDFPAPDQIACVDADCTITVRLDNSDDNLELDFQIFDYVDGGNIGNQEGGGEQPANAPDPYVSGVFVGPPPASFGGNNRWFSASNTNFCTGFAFAVSSSSSQDKTRGPRFLHKTSLTPATIYLILDAAVRAESRVAHEHLNQRILLRHSGDDRFAWSWFSYPLHLDEQGHNPAYWMLKWKDPDTWSLVLRRVSGELATYELNTGGKLVAFPLKLKLKLVGEGNREFSNWPHTVTLMLG